MLRCKFPSSRRGAACVRCGYKLKRRYVTPPVRECPDRCKYQGLSRVARVSILVLCGCTQNRSKKLKTFGVAECAKHGQCLPDYCCEKEAIAEDIISGQWAQPCSTCEDFEAASSPTATPAS